MTNKILFFALAGALAAPSAFAAQDTSGMRYTSAAEGFYASIRVRLNSGGTSNAGMDVQNSSSRIGIRGSSDIGSGNEFFYRYELGVGIDNSSNVSTRMGHVGLRGNFGQIAAGTMWGQGYNWVYGSTDIANVNSGNLVYNDMFPGRQNNAIEYTTPNMNGFQGAIMAVLDDGGTATAKDENDIDKFIIAANYAIQGFTFGASYTTIPDDVEYMQTAQVGTGTRDLKDDRTAYALKLGYAQDNWYINGWYAEDNASDFGSAAISSGATQYTAVMPEDTKRMSFAGGASMGKVNIYAVYEQGELNNYTDRNAATGASVKNMDDTYTTLGAQYNFNGQSRVWLEYAGRDLESSKTADDYFTLGLRHDF